MTFGATLPALSVRTLTDECESQERLDVTTSRVAFSRSFLPGSLHSEGHVTAGGGCPEFPDLEKPVLLWAGGDVVTADLGTFEPPIMTIRRPDADGLIRLLTRGESAHRRLQPLA